MSVDLETVSRRAAPLDNVVIATRTLPAGLTVRAGALEMTLPHTVLEGHRFATQPLQPGDLLTSWGQAFGTVIRPIAPGAVLCNENVLRELGRRTLDFPLPPEPNFSDQIAPFRLDESQFRPAPALPRADQCPAFQGYRRAGNRGVGTRNMIVLLGTSALTGGFVRVLETHLKNLAAQYPNIDGIVAVAHTEGSTDDFNNGDLLLRTLAGMIVHPNVGAVLVVDRGTERVNNAALREYLEREQYPLSDVLHQFMSLSRSFEADIQTAVEVVRGWLTTVSGMQRSQVPVSELRIGLQCGGSDAFSGISGNPLAAWVTKEIVRYGGAANLAETDELIGAEAYLISHMRDLETARKFLHFAERFRTWMGWHGQSADGNPSGGNIYRGLYNIYLKSLGAAAKMHPDLRVDAVIDYAERMRDPGFYFMDSPGNDLESVAGQIGAGCNLIFFVTGNGSITNFPFVPTIKIVTTTERYQLLANEMDVNAGAYLDGTPLEEVGAAALQLAIDVASGQLSAGEKAGHTQVQIWRDWRRTGPAPKPVSLPTEYSGQPLPIPPSAELPALRLPVISTPVEQVGLILPTSLCSGQIARMCAEWLNEHDVGRSIGLTRFVALAHTEGCGSTTEAELANTFLGYLTHPLVKHALLLEHGCEKTHNGYVQQLMAKRGLDPARFGWASVQLDGGIQKVMAKMIDWFSQQPAPVSARPHPAGVMRVGWMNQQRVSEELAVELAVLTRSITAAGGLFVLPANDPVVGHPAYQEALGIELHTTLGYAQTPQSPGLHIMDMPTRQWGEMLTGLGAAGVEVIVGHIVEQPMFGHPLIPVLQITTDEATFIRYVTELDAAYRPGKLLAQSLLDDLGRTLIGQKKLHFQQTGNTDFQIARGLLGVSV
ncbi:MAG: UxaA family hydrolase [Anaerolineae bacterium]|nr:UxaA family hydrolase [Anaerolineae bacterium]